MWILMVLLVIVVVATIGFFIAGVAAFTKKKKEAEEIEKQGKKNAEAAAKLDIHLRDAMVKDILHIRDVGPNCEDVTFEISGLHTYEDEDGFQWGEAYGDWAGKTVFIEFVEDDEIEIFVKLGKMDISLKDVGISEDDLWKIDDDEEGSVSYNGEDFEYDDSGEVMFYKDGLGDGEKFYSWDFMSEDGLLSLSFEKYGSDKVTAGLCHKVGYRQIELTRP